ncbi:acyl-CoA N-acyltransferase [Mycena epipterygia]|nr:acyl-CoA N-acyltransferase [Mycena epipterygia]
MDALEFNATTGEPFLRLPAPFADIIITPPRMSDVEPSVAILRDPLVHSWMGSRGPGASYSAAQAEGWLTKIKAETDAVMAELRAAPTGPASGCPVRHLRAVQADGTDIFIGDVVLSRSGWTEVLDAEERARLVAENDARVVGDPDIVWHVGYYLAPSHQGRGLMTAAVGTLITQWGIPCMNTRCIRSGIFEGNHGSLKVLLKNGFVLVDTLVDHIEVGEGEKKLSVYLVERIA